MWHDDLQKDAVSLLHIDYETGRLEHKIEGQKDN